MNQADENASQYNDGETGTRYEQGTNYERTERGSIVLDNQ